MPSRKRKIGQLEKERKVAERIQLIERIRQIQYSSDALRSSKNLNQHQSKKGRNLKPAEVLEVQSSNYSSDSDFEASLEPPVNLGPGPETTSEPFSNMELDLINTEFPSKKSDDVNASTRAKPNNIEQENRKLILTKKPSNAPSEKSFYINISRKEEYSLSRSFLPVVAEEQHIMEMINDHDIVFLCAETGSGKTTQVPQFLYEAGFGDPSHPTFPGMVGITQPRRIAAVTTARRVSDELNVPSQHVSYQVRYDKSTVGPETRIKFMTDGILVRELTACQMNYTESPGSAILLSQYSCIILDEVHERTINTDLLIGWLTRLVRFRNSGKVQGVKPLKVIIMSATFAAEEMIKNPALFPGNIKPPLISIPGRQYKVAIHHNRLTPDKDYLDQVYKKILKIHTRLPEGTVLAFVTGRSEVETLVRKLKEKFHQVDDQCRTEAWESENESLSFKSDASNIDLDISEDKDTNLEEEEEEQIQFLGEFGEEDKVYEQTQGPSLTPEILPLYSLLNEKEQMKVFLPVKQGQRRIVIATNVAETSITIPGVKYVVDCGKVKEKFFDSGVERFRISWTSKASADQRAGRAGRLGPGHCYRLFSSAVFDQYFDAHKLPEIVRSPIETAVLALKSVGIERIERFPLPTPLEERLVRKAETLLLRLGALQSSSKGAVITSVGKSLARFPTHPRYAKMIYTTLMQFPRLLPHILALISGLVVSPLFVTSQENPDHVQKVLKAFDGKAPCSDFVRIISGIGAYSFEAKKSDFDITKFCSRFGIRVKAMEEAVKLRSQLLSLVETWNDLPSEQAILVRSLRERHSFHVLDENDKIALCQIALSAFSDQVAVLDTHSPAGISSYKLMEMDVPECRYYIHRSSSLFGLKQPPQWILFTTITSRDEHLAVDNSNETSDSSHGSRWLRGITGINPSWLWHLGSKALIRQGKILESPPPCYKVGIDSVIGYFLPTYGPHDWPLPIVGIPLISLQDSCPLFAKFLLEGSVQGTRFDQWKANLIVKPNIISKSWAQSQPRVTKLIQACLSNSINSQKTLFSKWKDTPLFLLEEILLWYRPDFQETIRLYWPPIEGKFAKSQ